MVGSGGPFFTRPSRTARPAALPPSSPVTPTRSPGRAPSRPTTASADSAQPTTVTARVRAGPRARSPPAIVTPHSAASASAPRWTASTSASPSAGGSTTDRYASRARPPTAATSDSAPARARQPASSQDACPSRKCVPSTITSVDTTATPSARTTAASSPSQRTTREPSRRLSNPRIASMSASSPMAVHDARAVEVVRRDLDPHPVAGEDADAKPPHLPGHVAQDLVAVVELHPEHGVRERLDDLAFELDLLFLRQIQMIRTFVACGPLGDSPSSYSTFAPSVSVRKPSPAIPLKWTNASLPPSSGVMKPKPFSSLNHFTTPVAIPALPWVTHA